MAKIIKRKDGSASYYNEEEVLHRENGPAYIDKTSGCEIWYINGVIHRDDGPAIIWYDVERTWYKDGLRHREDGPAVEADGESDGWFLNDCYFSTKESWFEALTEEQKAKAFYSEYFIKS
jgi:hypothetical protein